MLVRNLKTRSCGFIMSGLLLGACISGPAQAQAPSVPRVDPELLESGKKLYAKDCSSCHGTDARGGSAKDLIRSTLVLEDRYDGLGGREFKDVLTKAPHQFSYSAEQLKEISQFLTYSVNLTLRSSPTNRASDLLSGDAKGGATYFAKNCASCHSPSGDLAGIGKRFDPLALQQRWVFPNRVIGGMKKKTQVTVTAPHKDSIKGTLIRIDDFHVTLRTASGDLETFARKSGVSVKVEDPLQGHYELLNRYTNDDIHNMTTYLETLK